MIRSARRRGAIPGAVLVLILVISPVSRADHDDGVYELPSIAQWSKTHLNVVVVPPNHGQLWNPDKGALNDGDYNELTPFNSYLKAIERAIGAWGRAVDMLGAPWLREAYKVDVYVLGRDDIPPDVLVAPDILVITDEDQGGALGTAIRVIPCVVRMSKIELVSFTYADMYNVTAQEFGHCLGLRHVGSQGGVDPLSDQKHPEHDVMNGFYTHWVGWPDTHLHCISNLNIVALEYVFSRANPSFLPTGGPSAITYMPVSAYGSTCEPPPADWRRSVPDWRLVPPGSHEPISSEIDEPSDGATIRRKELTEIAGTVTPSGGGSQVMVALARQKKDGCRWWVDEEERFASGDCEEPVWNESTSFGSGWLLEFYRTLPKGRYRTLSQARLGDASEECCERGRSDIGFKLRR